jgi:sugar O-acyltransferase (sialic acid O-acetyltransferase NeuD family)
MTQVVGFGAGGHSKVVIEILRCFPQFEIVGLLDPRKDLWGTQVLRVHVMGDDSLMSELKGRGIHHAFIGIGTTGDTSLRKQLYEKVLSFGFQLVAAIHPSAVVSPSATIGAGPTIMAGAMINADTRLGDNVIVNTGAIVEHDCVVGNHSHIATGARLAGGVHVGGGTHVGLGALIRQKIQIGEDAIVGAGAVVVRDVPDGKTVVGVPARIHHKGE